MMQYNYIIKTRSKFIIINYQVYSTRFNCYTQSVCNIIIQNICNICPKNVEMYTLIFLNLLEHFTLAAE